MTDGQSAHRMQIGDLPSVADFRVGSLLVSPSRRLLEGPAGAGHVQPQVMAVFLCLANHLDNVVTRRSLFENCWGNAPVGDDSLNRALSAIRQLLKEIGAAELSVETVPRTGYRLALSPGDDESAERPTDPSVEAAYDCWRAGLPVPDFEEIEALEATLKSGGGNARAWGLLALLLRKAAEYCDAHECAELVRRCEQASRKSLALDPRESNARLAMAGLLPLFGNWSHARRQLTDILRTDPLSVPARHDLAVLEMATGRPSAAVPLIEQLLAEDGLAASFHYKRMYHLWTIGDLNGAEQAASHALQLWPHHPAVWAARFWTLMFTDRAEQALRFVSEPATRPAMPLPAAEFLAATATIAGKARSGTASSAESARHVQRCVAVAALGPAQAVAALLSLCALDAIDTAFEVARGYYLGQGPAAAPLRWKPDDPSITDQHRRVTQVLFIPAAQAMRGDQRFLQLCKDIGLTDYWDRFAVTPDFLRKN